MPDWTYMGQRVRQVGRNHYNDQWLVRTEDGNAHVVEDRVINTIPMEDWVGVVRDDMRRATGIDERILAGPPDHRTHMERRYEQARREQDYWRMEHIYGNRWIEPRYNPLPLLDPKAAARAEGLLLSCLSLAQREHYTKSKYFDCTGSKTKRKYRIDCRAQTASSNIIGAGDEFGFGVTRFCAYPSGNIPLADKWLGQKLMIETDEAGFLAIAVKSG